MADLKFSCPECGQHIAYGPPWAGLRIECPACRAHITVPASKPMAVPLPRPTTPAPAAAEPAPIPAKLSAGATDVPRQAAPPPAPIRKPRALPLRGNPALNYAVMLLLVAVIGGLGYYYGLPLLKGSSEEAPGAAPAPPAKTAPAGARRAGPMGEVNEAMDVSDALDGSSAKARPAATTNATARPRPARPPQ